MPRRKMADALAGVDGCEDAYASANLPRPAVRKINKFLKEGLARRDEQLHRARAYMELGAVMEASVASLDRLAGEIERLPSAEAAKRVAAEKTALQRALSEAGWKR